MENPLCTVDDFTASDLQFEERAAGQQFAFGAVPVFLGGTMLAAARFPVGVREAGDFFVGVPPGGDVYVLKQVLHDWEDAEACSILRRCREAMKSGAKLLIFEQVIADRGPTALLGALIDLMMLVVHAGRERTQGEFESLLRASGFELTQLKATHTPISLLEAVPIKQ